MYGIVVTDPIDDGKEILQVIKVAEEETPLPILNETKNETAIQLEEILEIEDIQKVQKESKKPS